MNQISGRRKSYWRRVLASSAVYAAAGWAAVEALTTVVDRFGLPEWLATLVTALYVAGLPVTVFLVWRTAGEERRLNLPSFVGAMAFLVIGTVAIFWMTRPPPASPSSIVAVVPCAFSGEDSFAYRAEGVAEDVHARLSRVESVKLSSWNSSLFVRDRGYGSQEIADTLNADRLVKCHLTSGKQRVELSAELIDPRAGRLLWSRDYDFVAADMGTVVTELAGALLDALGTPVEAAEMERVNDLGTFSPEAYDLYLQASTLDHPDASDPLIVQALKIDPNFPQALVLHAGNYGTRSVAQNFESMEQPRAWLYEARRLSQRALELDPGVYDARNHLAFVCGMLAEYYEKPCPDGEAERLRREECEVRGDSAEGWACRYRLAESGEESDEAIERWLELEPTSVMGNTQYMGELWRRGADLSEILEVFEILRALDPDDRRPFGLISNLLRRNGWLDEVLGWRYGAFGDQLPEGLPWHLARLGTDYMNLGLYEQARVPGEMTAEVRPSSAVHFMHILWKRLGEPGKAIELLDWNGERIGATTPSGYLYIGQSFAADLGRYDLAKGYFDRTLALQDLLDLCDGADDCVAWSALLMSRTERMLDDAEAAAAWLETAVAAMAKLDPDASREDALQSRQSIEAALLIEQGRHAEAVETLRQIALSWTYSPDGRDLQLPIYRLEISALYDPLRERSDFQQLVAEYNQMLEPMRERVIEAQTTGNWESLRQRTFDRATTGSGRLAQAPAGSDAAGG
jgi:TolB-like protein/tetratricopeptide (TPR) repeat protein